MRIAVLAFLAACHHKPPVGTNDDAPYPLRFPKLSPADHDARLATITARNPHWKITLDDYGFLIEAIGEISTTSAKVVPVDLPSYQQFVDANRDILGLDAPIDLAHLPPANRNPMSNDYELVYKQPMTDSWFGTIQFKKTCPHEAPGPECAFPVVAGHAWPGWRGVPGGIDEDDLVARVLGRPVEYVDMRCRDLGTCSGRDECVETQGSGSEPARRAIVTVQKRYQQHVDAKTGAVELRLHAFFSVKSARCSDADREHGRTVRSRSASFPVLDAVTGEAL